MANPCGVSAVILALTAGIVVVLLTLTTPTSAQSSVSYPSQYVTYRYRYRARYYRCYRYYYTYCYRWYYWRYWRYRWYYPYRYYYNWWYGWGYWPYCYRRASYCCYYRYYWKYVTRRRCRTKWTGRRCNIPVCSPRCENRRRCVNTDLTRNINQCSCQTPGGGDACQIVPCSRDRNCYPGTCVSNVCQCPSAFNGTNCVTISQQPSIGECFIKLYAKPSPGAHERVVGTATCEDDDLEPLSVWVGDGLDFGRSDKGITKLEVNWKASYTNPLSMPDRPTTEFFISNAPVQIGITGGRFTIQFDGTATLVTKNCNGLDPAKPVTATTTECGLQPTWTSLSLNSRLTHNNTMTISVFNNLGGQKKGDGGVTIGSVSYGFGTHTFTGEDATKQAKFQFDFKRPTHCLLENNVADVIDRKANCTVFPISLEEDIRTDATVTPRFLGWTDDASRLDRFEVEVYLLREGTSGTLHQLGDPEETATVTPDLNNFHYTAPQPGVYAIVVTVYDAANNTARARKIFNYNDQPGFTETDAPVYFMEAGGKGRSFITTLETRHTLTLNWTGRFVPNHLELSKRVEPWEIDQNSIDDVYGTTFGLRSIDAVSNVVGISNMSCIYLVDSKNGGRGFEEPQLDSPMPDGVVVGNCSADLDTETSTLSLYSPLENGDTIVVWLKASDHRGQAGTTTLKFKSTVDISRPNITKGQFQKNRDDKYFSYMEITVEDRESGINSTRYRIVDRITGTVIVKDVAPAVTRHGLENKRRKRDSGPVQPCTADDPTCYCIPRGDCFPYTQEIEIDHCNIDRFKGDTFKLDFFYVVTNQAGQDSPENSISMRDLGDIECRPNELPPGVIAGIVIAVIIGLILLILLIVIIVLMLIRIRQGKRAVPERFRTMANQARKRFTMYSSKTEDNELYAVNDSPPPAYPGQARHQHVNHGMDNDDMYVDKSDFVPAKIPRKQLQMMDTIAEGRFAIVRKAHLNGDKDRSVVAAKALKNGFSKPDEQLMSQKLKYMSDVPPHRNLVQFIGEVDESGAEGPIMLLELCDESLKDWLNRRISLSTDDLEAILGFSLNIASGVEHLHSHKIIHRRLGVRNVLLQQQANGLVAKLIGFGPSAEDMDSPSDKRDAATSVPIKWLAPETLDTLNSKKPTYNEKTDAWSYGITLWEMYSKGAAPFGDLRSADVKGQIKRGHRMSCPTDCPPELFDSVIQPCWHEKANKRPTFKAICRSIEEFRHGANTQTGYYAANDDDMRPSRIYDDGQ